MNKDLGALSGSQAMPGAAEEASPPIGFDPARIDDYRDFPFAGSFTQASSRMGWPAGGLVISASNELAVVCTDNGLRNFSGWTPKGFHYCPNAPWQDWVRLAECILDVENRRHAIATEAGTAETVKLGSVHEGAGRNGIARGPSQ